MAQWRLRPPAEFAKHWHEVMTRREGEHVIYAGLARSSAERQQVEWRMFQYSLRNHPSHPTAQNLSAGVHFRTSLQFDASMNKWIVWLVIRPSTKFIAETMQVFVK